MVVVESLAEGAVVSEARQHGISPQQLFGWRAKLRTETAIDLAIPPVPIAVFTLRKRTLSPVVRLFIEQTRDIEIATETGRKRT